MVNEDYDFLKCYTPKNIETLEFTFRGAKVAKMVGQVASQKPRHGTPVAGLLVKRDFGHSIMSPEDLPTYTQLLTTQVLQRQVIPFPLPPKKISLEIRAMFDDVVIETAPLCSTVDSTKGIGTGNVSSDAEVKDDMTAHQQQTSANQSEAETTVTVNGAVKVTHNSSKYVGQNGIHWIDCFAGLFCFFCVVTDPLYLRCLTICPQARYHPS